MNDTAIETTYDIKSICGFDVDLFCKKRVTNDASVLKIIVDAVVSFGHYNGVTHEQIFNCSRKREGCMSRQTAMYFIREFTTLGVVKIGWFFDRDHTTIINGIKAIENMIDTDKNFKLSIDRVRSKIKSDLGMFNYEKGSGLLSREIKNKL